jgi:hypothetical protein
MEFFVLQTFLGIENGRPAKYIDDPRFRGVYFLMAMKLPQEQAQALRERLILYAAQSHDHTVSDGFVKLLALRRRLAVPEPTWANDFPIAEEELELAVSNSKVSLAQAIEHEAAAERALQGARRLRSVLWSASDRELRQLASEILCALGATKHVESDNRNTVRLSTPVGVVTLASIVRSEDLDIESIAGVLHDFAASGDNGGIYLLVFNVQPEVAPSVRSAHLDPDVLEMLSGARVRHVAAAEIYRIYCEVRLGSRAAPEAWEELQRS